MTSALAHMNDFVTAMHETSGLLDEIPDGVSVAEAEFQALEYIQRFVPLEGKAPLAGNTIGTDRMFLAKYMPRVDRWLHYRNVDVSSIKELSRRWYPRAYIHAPAKDGGHRALADIRESIRELAYYRRGGLRSASRDRRATAHGPPRPPPFRRSLPECERIVVVARSRGRHGGYSSVGRAPGCGPGGRGFKSRYSPQPVEVHDRDGCRRIRGARRRRARPASRRHGRRTRQRRVRRRGPPGGRQSRPARPVRRLGADRT